MYSGVVTLSGVGTAVTCNRAGLFEPMVKELTDRGLLVLLALSLTLIVQLSYVPSPRVLKVIVLSPTEVELSELLQLPPNMVTPASVEEKV